MAASTGHPHPSLGLLGDNRMPLPDSGLRSPLPFFFPAC